MPASASARRSAKKARPSTSSALAIRRSSDDQLLDAMLAHPILINRPVRRSRRLGTRLCRPSEVVLDILPETHKGAVRQGRRRAGARCRGQASCLICPQPASTTCGMPDLRRVARAVLQPSAAHSHSLRLAPHRVLQPPAGRGGRPLADAFRRRGAVLRSRRPAPAGRRAGQPSEGAGAAGAVAMVGRPGLGAARSGTAP